MLSFGKFITGALISAFIAIGGVWFVVDISLRGVEKSVDVTNQRITDLQSNISELRSEVKEEFEKTRSAIERASFDLFKRDSESNSFEIRITADNNFNIDEFYKAVHRQEFEIVKVQDTSTVDIANVFVQEFAFVSSFGGTGVSAIQPRQTITVSLGDLPQTPVNFDSEVTINKVFDVAKLKVSCLTLTGKIFQKVRNTENFSLTYSKLKQLSNTGSAFIKYKVDGDIALLPIKVNKFAN